MTTNYFGAFITVSPDSAATMAATPAKPGSVAALQHALLTGNPYGLTSDDLLFEVHAIRAGIAPIDRAAARAAFFSRPQACLRASPLVKQYGWGLHHDAEGRVAAVPLESDTYRSLVTREDIKVIPGMRSSRKG